MSIPEPSERERIATLAQACACHNLRRVTRMVTQHYDAALAESGVRVTQLPLLVALHLGGEQTINGLAERLELDRTTLTRNLKPLRAEGLVSVRSGEDQRTRVVALTEVGRTRLLRALPLWERVQSEVVEGIGNTRFAPWLSQLEALSALVGSR